MSEFLDAVKENKLTFGLDRTLKNLKAKKVKKVFLAFNCSKEIKEKIKEFKAEVIELDMNNEEIAIQCKKPFSISVLSV
jgi:ribosomal protein L30E